MSGLRKRIGRDLTAVVIFCSAFFGVVLLINYLKAGADAGETTDFSEYRTSADAAVENRDYSIALTNYQTMLDRDPFDGRARYMLAKTRYNVFQQIDKKLIEIESVGNQEDASANPQVASLKEEREALLALGISEFEAALEHPRYAENCCYFLSILHIANDEHDLAIDYLARFVDAGRYLSRGIANVKQFQLLRDHESFPAIVNAETKTRQKQLGSSMVMAENTITLEAALPQQVSRSPVPAKKNEVSLFANYRGWFGYNMIRLGHKLVDLVGEFFK
jgi:tetratricopeptide (TPR) repeat protein